MSIKVPSKVGGKMNRFVKGESGNPKGRPRKIATELKHEGYTKGQVQSTIDKMIAMAPDELKKFKKDKNATLLELGVARMIEDYIGKGKTEILEYLLSKKNSSEVTSKVTVRKEIGIEETKELLKENGIPGDQVFKSSTEFLKSKKKDK